MSERVSLLRAEEALLKPGVYFMQGNIAAAEAALVAGCRFFAGYPITPSNEIAEHMSRRLPQVGGYFIQFEDEIASVIAISGAAYAGVKSMTATSGPGFSLMQEGIGMAAMIEAPIVIINVQRGGPSTGLPTLVGQGDVMQAKWGSHGDYEIVAYLPSSVQEMFDLTIQAFNTAWTYRVPVIVLPDQRVGQMIEKLSVPDYNEIPIAGRIAPEEPPEEFLPFNSKYLVPPMAFAGEGYRFHVTSLTHDERGYPSTSHKISTQLVTRLIRKIRDNEKAIGRYESVLTDDANLVVVAYGITARSALKAVKEARKEGLKVGLFRPVTAWPFPYWGLKEAVDRGADIVVVEINMGQMVRVIREHFANIVNIHSMTWAPGDVPRPHDILVKIKEVYEG
ncbi:MAG: 2-oxoacid:acceptor oxidoreductase subunit alpha [Thermoprotei archaeon]|nr:2-oxoacid:acceptor oxidoreductase subunit alpha [Thermoprotei archaeon]